MVKQQVESQIKVRDFSKLAVTLAPADYESWHVARTETMAEAKAGLKAKLEAELSAAADESELQGLRDRFSREERELEHKIGASTERTVETTSLFAQPQSARAQTTRCTPSRPRSTCSTTSYRNERAAAAPSAVACRVKPRAGVSENVSFFTTTTHAHTHSLTHAYP